MQPTCNRSLMFLVGILLAVINKYQSLIHSAVCPQHPDACSTREAGSASIQPVIILSLCGGGSGSCTSDGCTATATHKLACWQHAGPTPLFASINATCSASLPMKQPRRLECLFIPGPLLATLSGHSKHHADRSILAVGDGS